MDGSDPRTAMVRLLARRPTSMLDPHLVDAIGKIETPTTSVARASVHMPTLVAPFSPTPPTDQTILENPDDATKRYRLGGFTLASTGVASQRVKWVELRPENNGYTLEVHITPQAELPAGIVALPATVPLETHYFVHATVNGMVREWTFQTAATTGADVKLLLHIDGRAPDFVAQREALYHAMTSSPDAKLVVRRALHLAIPTGLPRRWLFAAPVLRTATAGITPLLATNLRPIGLPVPTPFPHPVPHPPLPLPQPPLSVSSVTIDSALPFVFDTKLDQNVFAKLTSDVGTSSTGWNPLKSLWQPDPASAGVLNYYFQDRSDPRVVYFLPDQFVVQRRPGSPHKPWLSLSTLSDPTKAALNYVVVPDWEVDRVTAAVVDLVKQGVPANHYPLQLFPAADAVLSLKVPRADPQGGPGFVTQTGASIDTTTAIHGSVTLLVDDSSSVISAILNDDSDLFSGLVTITVAGLPIKIPFVARAAQFVGDVCDFAMATDAAASTITVTATNAIESPIEVDALGVAFIRAGVTVPVDATDVPDLPTTLAPGDSLAQTFSCSPAAFDGIAFQPDPSKLTVQPDAKALIDLIVDPNLPGTATRDVKFNVFAAAFAPPTIGPALAAVQIVFDGSESTVSLLAPTTDPKPPFVTGVAHLRIPLRDFLLGATSQYRYAVHRIYADGTQQISDPVGDTLDEVFVAIPAAGM